MKIELTEKQINLLKQIVISEQDKLNKRKNTLTRKRENKKVKDTEFSRHEEELEIIDGDLEILFLLRDQLNYI